MPPVPQAPAPVPEENTKTLLPWLLAIFFVCAIVGAGYIAFLQGYFSTPEPQPAPIEDKTPVLSGSLLMASALEGAPATMLERINAATGERTVLYPETDYYPFSVAPSGTVAAMTPDSSGAWGISIARSMDELYSGSDVSLVFPLAPALRAWHTAWSPDSRFVAYDAQAALPTFENADIAHSYVILLDTATLEQTIVDRGASPVFIENGTIAYIGEDGVMLATHDGMNVGEISYLFEFPEEYVSQTSSQLAYSGTTKHLVMTDPPSDITYIMNIENDEDGLFVSNIHDISLRGVSPTISPSGTHVALTDRNGMRVVSIDLVSRDVRDITPLTGYDVTRTVIGAWK
jgi:hypothetical protein